MDRLQPECLTGVDLAPGMLSYAREHHAADNIRWVCGDAEALPLAGGSVDLIFPAWPFSGVKICPGCLLKFIGYYVRVGSLSSVLWGRKVFAS